MVQLAGAYLFDSVPFEKENSPTTDYGTCFTVYLKKDVMERDIRRDNSNEENNRAVNENEADRLQGFAAAEMADRGPKIIGNDRIERPGSEEGTFNNASYTPGDEDDDIDDEDEDDLILGDEDELDDDDNMEVADVEIDDELDEDDFDEDDLVIDADDDEDEDDDL